MEGFTHKSETVLVPDYQIGRQAYPGAVLTSKERVTTVSERRMTAMVRIMLDNDALPADARRTKIIAIDT